MAAIYTTLAEVKTHLRVDFSDDDTYITSLQEVAEALVLMEITGKLTGEGTVTTAGDNSLIGVDTRFTNFAVGDVISVDNETFRTIATVVNNTSLTVTPAFTSTAAGLTYSIYTGMPKVSGVIAPMLKQAILLMIGHFYMLREPAIIGVSINKVPYAFEYLVSPYKNWTISI